MLSLTREVGMVRGTLLNAFSGGIGLLLVGSTALAQAANVSVKNDSTTDRHRLGWTSARPSWIKPNPADVVVRKQIRNLSSVRDGITLTDAQTAKMTIARDQHRPRIRALLSQFSARRNTLTEVERLALTDSLQATIAAQREAVLAVLTPKQRATYDENIARGAKSVRTTPGLRR